MDKKHSIGGQALVEGVMMRSKSAMVLCVRGKDEEIFIESERIKARPKFWRLPVLRGIYSFGSSLKTSVVTIVKAAEVVDLDTASADESGGEGSEKYKDITTNADVDNHTDVHMNNDKTAKKKEKAAKSKKKDSEAGGLGGFAIFIGVFLGLVLSIGLFFFAPRLISDAMQEHIFDEHFSEITATFFNSIVRGIISLGLFIGYLSLMLLVKSIRRNFQYHGAEHKTINCYEQGLDLTIENVAKCDKRHNRCGTTFMFLVMIISIIVFMFVDLGLNWLFSAEHGLYIENRMLRNLVFMPIRLVIFLPIVAGISYEILFLLAKMKDNWFVRVIRAPGLALQRLTTKEPDEKMIEVAIKAFELTLRMEEDKEVKERKFGEYFMSEAKDLVEKMVKDMGIESAEGDWMLCFVLNCKRSELTNIEKLDKEQGEKLNDLIKRRREGVPLDYCFGMSSFYGRDICVDERVLIPRSETEGLCESAIKWVKKYKIQQDASDKISILDMCTGSGCIAFTLAKELNDKVEITAADISGDALEVAKKNLDGLGVELIKSDLFGQLAGRKFDLIVSNPPYIKTGDINSLQNEVKVQPHLALDGGEDGLDFYKRIIGEAGEHLNDGGAVMFEVGMGQADDVAHMSALNNFETAIYKDLAGIDRIVVAIKK